MKFSPFNSAYKPDPALFGSNVGVGVGVGFIKIHYYF
jgi:hypothetical protein